MILASRGETARGSAARLTVLRPVLAVLQTGIAGHRCDENKLIISRAAMASEPEAGEPDKPRK